MTFHFPYYGYLYLESHPVFNLPNNTVCRSLYLTLKNSPPLLPTQNELQTIILDFRYCLEKKGEKTFIMD